MTRKEYLRNYCREWVRNKRATYFKDKMCVQCGSKEKLELDHIVRETKISHSVWSWKEERRNKELEKCQVLCKKCHSKKTAMENSIMLKGKPHPCRKLTKDQVELIKKSPLSKRKLATLYNVGATTIQSIREGTLYRNF